MRDQSNDRTASPRSSAHLVVQIRLKSSSPQPSGTEITELALLDPNGKPHPLPQPARLLHVDDGDEAPWTDQLMVDQGRFAGVKLTLAVPVTRPSPSPGNSRTEMTKTDERVQPDAVSLQAPC